MATGDIAQSQGAYRFWSNQKVTFEGILKGHIEGTVSRASECQTVLSIQDTTDLDYTSHPHTEGLGFINQTNQQGIKVHSCFAVSGAGAPLGLLHQHCWVRPDPPVQKKAPNKVPNAQRPIEEKESYRWLTTLTAAEATLAGQVQLVQVADREADIFELFSVPRQRHSELLIRAKSNRKVKHELGRLIPTLNQAPILGQMTVELARNPQRAARIAPLQMRALAVTIEVPKHLPHPAQFKPLELNAILVEETVLPADGSQPIRWMLLTTLPIETFEQVCQCVRWYSYRWLIERFHYTLKSGCGVEDLQLQTRDRLLKALATYNIVAWRLMAITYQARLTPDVSCEAFLHPEEWRLLRRRFVPKSRSKKPPTLRQAILWIAQLGGFLDRKRDGHPGLKTLWRGFSKLSHLLEGAQLAHKA